MKLSKKFVIKELKTDIINNNEIDSFVTPDIFKYEVFETEVFAEIFLKEQCESRQLYGSYCIMCYYEPNHFS